MNRRSCQLLNQKDRRKSKIRCTKLYSRRLLKFFDGSPLGREEEEGDEREKRSGTEGGILIYDLKKFGGSRLEDFSGINRSPAQILPPPLFPMTKLDPPTVKRKRKKIYIFTR